ncbi:MAG: LysM peptidoglycan-binding domain-containing protein, partial [Bacteroidia bacterium]
GQKLVIYTPVKSPAAAAPEPPAQAGTAPAQQTQTQNTPPAQTKPAAGTYTYYTVKSGDNLWKIAQKYGTTVEEIKKLNGYGAKYKLYAGQKIKVKKN